jgi:hypothetical protein
MNCTLLGLQPEEGPGCLTSYNAKTHACQSTTWHSTLHQTKQRRVLWRQSWKGKLSVRILPISLRLLDFDNAGPRESMAQNGDIVGIQPEMSVPTSGCTVR